MRGGPLLIKKSHATSGNIYGSLKNNQQEVEKIVEKKEQIGDAKEMNRSFVVAKFEVAATCRA